MNGSYENINCKLASSARPRCREPTTSVLQDGIIPTLTGLDGDLWASQLLTINTVLLSPITSPSYDGLRW